MTEVLWFRNAHEHRNYWLRFGFMRLHRSGELTYRELPLARCVEFGFDPAIAAHTHRHTSVILVRARGTDTRCIVDSEDSLFWMSPLIALTDLYFCVGFHDDFFTRRTMPPVYPWQTEPEVAFYRGKAADLISSLGDHFHKARRFSPIGPEMELRRQPGFLRTRWRNLRHRLGSATRSDLYWQMELETFEARYRELIALRSRPLLYDVVLLDTLWGWPRHRLALHRRLRDLSASYRIHSKLNWSPPNAMDGSDLAPPDPAMFPVISQDVSNYEQMLASSRLGVFATGFHWGWRNIVTLSLMMGLPVYMDAPLAQPWFSWSEFDIRFNTDGDWGELEKHLNSIDPSEWNRIRRHNQSTFDTLVSPEVVARYVLRTAAGL